MALPPTPSQTAGPYLALGMAPLERRELVPPGTPGAVTIEGRLLDGAGTPVPDGVVELWQPDAEGWPPDSSSPGAEPAPWDGFGRCLTDAQGRFTFSTARPGPVTRRSGTAQAPHLDMLVFARGLTRWVLTRMYFPGDPRNGEDPVLGSLSDARRRTLVAVATEAGYRFEIHLQGDDETVFFLC